ncbi:MAG: hypothetical protein Q9M19_01330 [Mariprofundaceae bacterium]|nr:hypothetical protein [Mariprofundaceae bacterium]
MNQDDYNYQERKEIEDCPSCQGECSRDGKNCNTCKGKGFIYAAV